jgi:hypothetical protein
MASLKNMCIMVGFKNLDPSFPKKLFLTTTYLILSTLLKTKHDKQVDNLL